MMAQTTIQRPRNFGILGLGWRTSWLVDLSTGNSIDWKKPQAYVVELGKGA